jgi:hypothetical protein
MLTQGEDVEVHALRQRGWTISAIARHVGRDPKTARYAGSGITGGLPVHAGLLGHLPQPTTGQPRP